MSELGLLATVSGLPLESYRREYVVERVRRAVAREGVPDEAALANLLGSNPEARVRFRRSVAVSVSGPFRDPHQFELLERELLPPLVASARRILVWSAGCADGSEVYSLATVLERLGALERSLLLGSDVLEENLEIARAHPDAARRRFHVRWERRDIASEGPPGGQWRLVLCRNVAIYLSAEAKRALHERLASALASDGILLLGRSERLSNPGALGLEAVGPSAYRRVREGLQ